MFEMEKPFLPSITPLRLAVECCIEDDFDDYRVSDINEILNFGDKRNLEEVMTLFQKLSPWLGCDVYRHNSGYILWEFILKGVKKFSNEKEILTHLKKNIKRFTEDYDIYV